LLGAAEVLAVRMGTPFLLPNRPVYERAAAGARASLGEDRFTTAWTAGQALAPEAAIAVAKAFLATVDRGAMAPAPTNPAEVAGLTPREVDVLKLVADGYSDREIAATLFVGPATVRTHLANAFGKLEVGSRTAAVAACHRLGIF
jgi:DNA-binding CsgD family transcriptional regulator